MRLFLKWKNKENRGESSIFVPTKPDYNGNKGKIIYTHLVGLIYCVHPSFHLPGNGARLFLRLFVAILLLFPRKGIGYYISIPFKVYYL